MAFSKDPYTPERLRALGLNERQIVAILHVKTAGRISNSEYQQLTRAPRRTATRDLDELVARGLLEQLGRAGRSIRYRLAGPGTVPNVP